MRPALRLFLCAAGFAGLTACAAGPPPGSSETVPSQAQSGLAAAQTWCASCHAIDLVSQSPRMAAPPFRDLRVRFNQITWERTMAQIAAGGHDEMPPVAVSDIDIRDLKVFIDTLR